MPDRFGVLAKHFGLRHAPFGRASVQADLEGARSAFEFAVSGEGCGRYFAARRSRFSRHGEEMLLTEYFLPELKRFIG